MTRNAFPLMNHVKLLAAGAVGRAEQIAARSPLAFSFAVAGLLVLAVLVLLPPSFQTNDDLQLAMIVAGKGCCLAPDEHLIFTNVLIGLVLKSLYSAMPSIPWYGLYLYAVQYLVQVSVLYCTLMPGYSRARFGLYLLYFAAVSVFCLNNLQFTTTALLAAGSGVLLWIVALNRSGDRSAASTWQHLAAGGACFVLASLVRLECLYLGLFVGLPAIAIAGWPLGRAPWRPAALVAGVCALLVAAFALYDSNYYQRDLRWRPFASYNKVRLKFNDYEWTSYSPQTAEVFRRANWSENDHAMIAHWFYADPVLYSESRLRQVLDAYPWQTARLTAEYFWRAVRMIVRDKALWPAALAAPFFWYCIKPGRRSRLAPLLSSATALGLLTYLAIFNKPPPARIYFPLLTFSLPLLLVASRREATLPRARWPGLAWRCLAAPGCWSRPTARQMMRPIMIWTLAIVAYCGTAYGFGRQVRHSYKMLVRRHELHQAIEGLKPRDDKLFVFWPPGFPCEAISPFDTLRRFDHVRLLVAGWPQTTPLQEDMKRRFRVTDVYRALYERDDVLLLASPQIHQLYCKFVEEHYGLNVRFQPSYDGGHRYDVAGRFEIATSPRIAGRPRTTGTER